MRTHISILLSGLFLVLAACENSPRDRSSAIPSSSADAQIFGEEKGSDRLRFAKYVVGISLETNEGVERICSGVLLSREIVLTAAHCSRYDVKKIKVHFTTSMETFYSTPESQLRRVRRVEIPKEYFETMEKYGEINPNDIAMLKLASPAPESAKAMAFTNAYIGKDQLKAFYVMGYGRASYNFRTQKATGSFDLRLTKIDRGDDTREGFLEVDQTKGKGACSADSGGPAFGVDADGRPMVFGVFTGNENVHGAESLCNGRGYFVDISKWNSWIFEASK